MPEPVLDVVTGAFGFSGAAIAEMLLAMGRRVRTLTNHQDDAHPLRARVEVAPLCFADADALTNALCGAEVLYNTYWIRFEHGEATFSRAVQNSRVLFSAAARAGVRRIVHVSITNPSADSPFPYFRGKAAVEQTLAESGVSHAILRPAVLFGDKGILLNNIAWLLRRLPLFGIFGDGDYAVQPVYVGDLAALAARMGTDDRTLTVDAVGPESYSFVELIRLIARRVGSSAAIVHVPPALAYAAACAIGWLVRDVMLTRDEVGGLMENLLVSADPPTCPTSLIGWLGEHADELGRTYQSELQRHFPRP